MLHVEQNKIVPRGTKNMVAEDYSILQNGVKMVMAPIQSHVSHIGLFINAGSCDENDPVVHGALHMIEHMLFKGTKNRTYLELLDKVESVGGDINAYTSKEETCIYISIQNDYIENAVDVLSDIFYSSQFLSHELDKEKEVVIDEIHSYFDSPQEYIYDEFEEKLFNPHSLSHNILGNETSVAELTVEKLLSLYNTLYVTDNIIISYAGGVPLKTVKQYINTYFSEKKIPLYSHTRNTEIIQAKYFSESIKKNTYQAHCILGTIAPSMHHPLKTNMVLLSNLLGGTSFNSQLNLLLREQYGLTYNIETNYTAYSNTGIFCVYFGTDASKVDLCKNLIYNTYNEIRTQGISPHVLEMYKKQLIGQIALSFDNHVSLMIANAKSYMNYERVDTYEEIIKKINHISQDTIIELAQTVLNPDSINELLYV